MKILDIALILRRTNSELCNKLLPDWTKNDYLEFEHIKVMREKLPVNGKKSKFFDKYGIKLYDGYKVSAGGLTGVVDGEFIKFQKNKVPLTAFRIQKRLNLDIQIL